MQLKPDCLACLYQQILRVTKVSNISEELAEDIMKDAAYTIAKDLPMKLTPPQAAAILYPKYYNLLKTDDPYRNIKKLSINKAKELTKLVESYIKNAKDQLDMALRVSTAGNVIDFASQKEYDLESEVTNIIDAQYAIDDKAILIERLKKSQNLLILADNSGEHIFDKLLLKTIKLHIPNINIYYATRGVAIINDVTYQEAKESGIDEFATIINSGVDTPCFLYERASKDMQKIYDNADTIIAKGMGNYECMEMIEDKRLFFLMKIKCSVVAQNIKEPEGSLICKNSVNI